MTFECNFHIVIHVTGLEIIFYIMEKGIATSIFHPLNRRSTVCFSISLFVASSRRDTSIDFALNPLALFALALHKPSLLLRLAGAKNRQHITAICCKREAGEERWKRCVCVWNWKQIKLWTVICWIKMVTLFESLRMHWVVWLDKNVSLARRSSDCERHSNRRKKILISERI